jgi:hypothetical protein
MPSGLDRTNSQQQQQKKAKRSTVNSILATAETPPTTGSTNPPPNTAKKQPQLNGNINKATANSNKKVFIENLGRFLILLKYVEREKFCESNARENRNWEDWR